MNPSGERLNNLTGVAAILRYALPQLEDIMEADDDDINKDSDDEDNFAVGFSDSDADKSSN